MEFEPIIVTNSLFQYLIYILEMASHT